MVYWKTNLSNGYFLSLFPRLISFKTRTTFNIQPTVKSGSFFTARQNSSIIERKKGRIPRVNQNKLMKNNTCVFFQQFPIMKAKTLTINNI